MPYFDLCIFDPDKVLTILTHRGAKLSQRLYCQSLDVLYLEMFEINTNKIQELL